MTAIATPVVEAWMYGKLSGDTTLMALAPGGVFNRLAPEGATYPFVVFSFMAGTLKLVVGASKLWEQLDYEVVGIDKMQNYAGLVPIANRIDALLHAAPTQAITGGTLESCSGRSPVRRDDPPVSGVVFTHLGFRYDIVAQTT
jgi:hypothetical protein